jgi:arylsulfatase A-like enzyme
MWLFRLRRFDRDVGTVLAAFIVLIAIENLVVGLGFRSEFVGTWEMGSARLDLSPIVLACSLPIAITAVLIARLAARGYVWPVSIASGLAGVALGIGVSTGRRVSMLPIRIPFVAVIALACGLVAWVAATQLRRVRSATVVSIGTFICLASWFADAGVLPRLYPAFHTALIILALLSWSTMALLLYGSRHAQTIAFVAILITGASIAWSPFGAKRVHSQDNLRRVLLEHAPLLGRAVLVAAKVAPPPPLLEDDDGAAMTTLTSLRAKGASSSKDGSRPLDWKGRDIVLVTIDALRADHVSAYGYPRKTTPNIDALAARGVRFDHAYCPTPHTSYSITSMMTGTYMKPLLALGDEVAGAAEIGETWPVQLRRYGYRTAAFYPPAVFFIDEHRFTKMRDENLGFEYYKEEFARPELRQTQVVKYLQNAPKDKPLFLWIHLFEPHEPYEMHPDHVFEGDPRVDAYDSEIAEADAFVGLLTQTLVAKRPPGGVLIVSADHGEEHGDHGGRYHGTTVFEEQVRVPLVIVGPSIAPHVVSEPVQTIDLLPTTLSALDIPVPPRLRGRDLGPAIAGTASADPEGLAFSETDDYTLLARGNDRLICQRKVGACSLFDVASDPEERRPISDRPDRVTTLKKLRAAFER